MRPFQRSRTDGIAVEADEADAAAAPPPKPRRLRFVVALAALVVAVDQATKWWAESALAGRDPVPLLGDFLQFRLVYNPGAAFSIGEGSTWVFTVFAAAAVVAIARFATRVGSLGWAVALGLLLGGAGTHLLDRLFRPPGFGVGHVVDFIDYNGWFVGNVADIALTFGSGVLLLLGFLGRDPDGPRDQVGEPGAEHPAPDGRPPALDR